MRGALRARTRRIARRLRLGNRRWRMHIEIEYAARGVDRVDREIGRAVARDDRRFRRERQIRNLRRRQRRQRSGDRIVALARIGGVGDANLFADRFV